MKTFAQIREKKDTGEVVFKKKYGKYPAEIKKEKNKFVAYIDGDRLADFRSEKDAKKGIEQMIKAL